MVWWDICWATWFGEIYDQIGVVSEKPTLLQFQGHPCATQWLVTQACWSLLHTGSCLWDLPLQQGLTVTGHQPVLWSNSNLSHCSNRCIKAIQPVLRPSTLASAGEGGVDLAAPQFPRNHGIITYTKLYWFYRDIAHCWDLICLESIKKNLDRFEPIEEPA